MYKRRNFFSILKKIFIISYIIYVSIILCKQYCFYIKERNIKKVLIEKILLEEKKQEKIKNELKNNLSDKYIESVARERLGLIKNDEILFIDKRCT